MHRSGFGLGFGRQSSGGGAPPPYIPWTAEPGAVLWMAADDAEVSTTSASVTDPADLSTANWTRTGMTAASGVLTSTATTATVQQVPANFSSGSGTWSVTWRVQYVSNGLSDWVALELFASGGGRAWFNLAAGAVGTVGAFVSASIQALGGGVYDLTVTTTAGGNYVMLRAAGADNSLVCSVGWSVNHGSPAATVVQTRVSAFANLVSGVNWAQVTASLQPFFQVTGLNGRQAFAFGGQQDITSTEAAVVAGLQNASNYTLFYVVSGVGASLGAVFGAGAVSNTVSMKSWGRSGAIDTWRYSTVDTTPTTITSTDTSGSYAAGSHQVTWSSTAGAVALRQDQAARSLDIATNNPTTVTPTKAAIGCRPRTTPDQRMSGLVSSVGLWNVALSGAAIARVEGYLKSKWGTP